MNFEPKTIYEGWKNYLTDNPSTQEVAKYRKEVCDSCPFNSTNAKKHSDYKTIRPDEHCISCGCTLVAAQNAPSKKCPENYWER